MKLVLMMELVVFSMNILENKVMTNISKSYIKLTIAIVLWSSIYHVAKYLVVIADVTVIAFFRFFITSICLLIWYQCKNGNIISNVKSSISDFWLIFFIGFFGVFVYTLSFFFAEKFISAEEVVILFALSPIVSAVLSFILLKDKISFMGWVGIVVALIGAIAVLSLSSNKCGKLFCGTLFEKLSIGQMLALLACFSISIYAILSKKAALKKINSRTINTFSTILVTILLFVNFMIFNWGHIFTAFDKPLLFWLALFYTAIFGTVIPYQFYMDAIQDIEVSKVTVFQNALPPCTILMGVFIHGNKLTGVELLAGLVILLGVIITNMSRVKTVC